MWTTSNGDDSEHFKTYICAHKKRVISNVSTQFILKYLTFTSACVKCTDVTV